MSSSIHDVLRKWSKEQNWPYMSSIMIANKDIPLFETQYGQHDYDWLLAVTKDRKCKEIDACVIRYEHENNLSKDYSYRIVDWMMVLQVMHEDKNSEGIKRLHGTIARYYYKAGQYKSARISFLTATLTLKNCGYYITSFFPSLAKWIVRKYNVFG